MKSFRNNPFYDILTEKKEYIEFNTNSNYEIETENIYGGRIRIYDGEDWHIFYYHDTSLNILQNEVKKLISKYEVKNKLNILKHKKLLGMENIELNNFSYDKYKEIPVNEKILFLKNTKNSISFPVHLHYKDIYVEKTFMTEDVYRKYNIFAYGLGVSTVHMQGSTFYTKTYHSYEDLIKYKDEIIDYCNIAEKHEKCTNKLKEGNISVIFSPNVTGILVHECFGHVFEADVRYENDIGERLTVSENLCICDDGNMHRLGYCPFDDDGIVNSATTIIKNGVINGYLTDRNTALKATLPPSGNGRCVKLNQEPISRMTNIYMAPTSLSKEKIFDSFNGIYILTANYGELNENGDLIISPSICQTVENGMLKDYIKIKKIQININDVFSSIELIGNDLEFSSTLFGGCGKRNQYPLLVSQGGPHILINGVECL